MSSWRDTARRRIAAALAALPADATEKDKRRACREAWPEEWGARELHPYKVWLDETKVQLGLKAPADQRARIATMKRHREKLSPRHARLLALYEASKKGGA